LQHLQILRHIEIERQAESRTDLQPGAGGLRLRAVLGEAVLAESIFYQTRRRTQ
jgi:hypothetical protein